MARFLKVGLRPKGLDLILNKEAVVQEHPLLNYYPNRCVLCGKCLYVCTKQGEQPFLTFARRGFDTIVSFYGEKASSRLSPEQALALVDICPVAALTLREKEK